MQTTNHTEALADMLGGRDVFRSILANSPRSDRDYNIFVGVPAHCLTAENSKVNFEQEFPYQVIDLLICRGEEAVLAIVFDAEYRDMERLFSTCLQAVPHEFLKSEELTEDAAEELCGQIESRLRCDRDDPLHTGIMLHSVRLRHAIFRAKKAKSEVRRIMEEGTSRALEAKHLIGSDGSVTGYGHACGMFCCQLTGSVGRAYVFAPQAVEKLKRAIAWHDSAGTDVTLENRLARLNQGLPSGSSQQQAARLKNLLQTPLEDFYQNYPKDGHHLNALLNHAQFLSRESSISAFGDREEIETYGDVIYVVRNLWEYTAHRDCCNADAAGTCEQILAYLSFPLWSQPSEAACKEQHSGEERSLQTQLDQLRPGVLDFSFAMMPLSHYFYAAACRTESEYPLWLYKTCIQPWLGLYVSGELCFGKAMQVVYDLFRSDDETRKADYFPLLYDILVEPVGTIV